MLFGLAFLGIKGKEWYDKYTEHHVPGASFDASDIAHDYPQIPIDQAHEQIFFSLYFAMTGLHALHMIIGLGIYAWLIMTAWKGRYGPEYHAPIEIGGLYWHFVDIVWIYLFPLLYLIDRTKLK
jgi:cytochrome c oxidase subunit 3